MTNEQASPFHLLVHLFGDFFHQMYLGYLLYVMFLFSLGTYRYKENGNYSDFVELPMGKKNGVLYNESLITIITRG